MRLGGKDQPVLIDMVDSLYEGNENLENLYGTAVCSQKAEQTETYN